MFHHHRPVFASVCSTTLSAPFTLKVEGGGSTSSSNWATPLGFGRTASPTALESEDERSPPSSPVHPFGKDTSIDSVQREQLLHQVRLIFLHRHQNSSSSPSTQNLHLHLSWKMKQKIQARSVNNCPKQSR